MNWFLFLELKNEQTSLEKEIEEIKKLKQVFTMDQERLETVCVFTLLIVTSDIPFITSLNFVLVAATSPRAHIEGK